MHLLVSNPNPLSTFPFLLQVVLVIQLLSTCLSLFLSASWSMQIFSLFIFINPGVSVNLSAPRLISWDTDLTIYIKQRKDNFEEIQTKTSTKIQFGKKITCLQIMFHVKRETYRSMRRHFRYKEVKIQDTTRNSDHSRGGKRADRGQIWVGRKWIKYLTRPISNMD